MSEFSEQAIIDAWRDNAGPWREALAQGAIKSREAVTNQAIIDAVCQFQPRRVLDIGCGEGWLLQALSAKGIRAEGIDAVPELVDAARRRGARYTNPASGISLPRALSKRLATRKLARIGTGLAGEVSLGRALVLPLAGGLERAFLRGGLADRTLLGTQP